MTRSLLTINSVLIILKASSAICILKLQTTRIKDKVLSSRTVTCISPLCKMWTLYSRKTLIMLLMERVCLERASNILNPKIDWMKKTLRMGKLTKEPLGPTNKAYQKPRITPNSNNKSFCNFKINKEVIKLKSGIKMVSQIPMIRTYLSNQWYTVTNKMQTGVCYRWVLIVEPSRLLGKGLKKIADTAIARVDLTEFNYQ